MTILKHVVISALKNFNSFLEEIKINTMHIATFLDFLLLAQYSTFQREGSQVSTQDTPGEKNLKTHFRCIFNCPFVL